MAGSSAGGDRQQVRAPCPCRLQLGIHSLYDSSTADNPADSSSKPDQDPLFHTLKVNNKKIQGYDSDHPELFLFLCRNIRILGFAVVLQSILAVGSFMQGWALRSFPFSTLRSFLF